MLTLSERWFTTQTSETLRIATATGSRPTATRYCNIGMPEERSKTSSDPFGVLTAKRNCPLVASGRTWPASNSTNDGPEEDADTWVRASSTPTATTRLAMTARLTTTAKVIGFFRPILRIDK